MANDGQKYYRIRDLAGEGKRWPKASEDDVLQWCQAGQYPFFVYIRRMLAAPTDRNLWEDKRNGRSIAAIYGKIETVLVKNMLDMGVKSIEATVFEVNDQGVKLCSVEWDRTEWVRKKTGSSPPGAMASPTAPRGAAPDSYILKPITFTQDKFLVANPDVERFEKERPDLTTGVKIQEESAPVGYRHTAAKPSEKATPPVTRTAVQYPPKLAAAIAAFEAVNGSDLKGKSPMAAMKKWLKDNVKDHPCIIHDTGKDNKQALEEILKVANWKPKGGVPKSS